MSEVKSKIGRSRGILNPQAAATKFQFAHYPPAEELLAVKNKRDQLERDIIHQKIVQKQREEKAKDLNTLLLIL